MLEVIIVGVFTLLGVITQRIIGFGLAAFLTPVALLFFNPAATVIIALLVGTLSCGVIAFGYRGQHSIVWPVVVRLLVCSIPGLLIGAYVVSRIDKSLLQIILGIVVIGSVLIQEYAFAKPTRVLAVSSGIALSGCLGGFLDACAGNAVPPIVLWMRHHTATPDQIRHNLAVLFIFMNSCSMAVIYRLSPDSFSSRAIIMSLWGML